MALKNLKKYKTLSETIVPIDFTPNDEKASARTFKFKAAHAILLFFGLTFGFSGWFVLTAKSVFIEVNPITARVDITGGINLRLGQRCFIRSGSYSLSLANEGYYSLNTELTVDGEQAQTHSFEMERLPGVVSIDAQGIIGARVQVDDVDVGKTPIVDLPIQYGEHRLQISYDRYLDFSTGIDVEGREVEQDFSIELEPAWAIVGLSTSPRGAQVMLDGEVIGITPIDADLLEGRREILLKLAGYKAWRQELTITAGEDFIVPEVTLEPAEGLVFISSNPSEASLTVGGEFKGLTPMELALTPGQNHELTFFKNGYQSSNSTVRLEPNQEKSVTISLQPITADVDIQAYPEDAELYVDGEYRGPANQTAQLMAASQQIEIRREGYVPHVTEFTSRPGIDQIINVTLISLEQARLEQIKPVVMTAVGQDLKLFYPGTFSMGASRREAGRRPNENLRDIQLERPFYFGFKEVTNAEYRSFDGEHSSGTVSGVTLNNENQPVVQISWTGAALFCNWLSQQEGLPLFYQTLDSEVVGFNPEATGYRLPTEAEWAWVARTNGSGNILKYPWGDQLPPPGNAGNFADITAQSYLGEIMFNYDDKYFATSPVGAFEPNFYDIYDLAGNVAEWVHDFYGAVGSIGIEVDPLGPELGQFHTIRGSSWSHGAITEMRLSFRDFGEEPRDDVGFRIARYLE